MNTLQRYKTLFESGQTREARDLLNSESTNRLGTDVFNIQRDPTPDPNFIAKDFGNGRVSRGLQFLELVSINSIGKNTNSVLNFDTVEIFVPTNRFSSNIPESEKLQIMYTSLGIVEIINNARDSNTIEALNTMLIKTYNDVLDGTFRVHNQRRLLPLIRVLARD